MPAESPRGRGSAVALLLVAMVSVQFGASIAKGLFPRIGAEGTTGLRTTFAALLLAGLWRPWRGALSRRAGITVLLYGAALGCMNLTFYLALERIPLGVTVAIEFMGPLAVALASSRQGLDFVWAALAGVGLVLILPLTATAAPLDPVGVGFALVAATCWALYIVFGKRASGLVAGGRATALGMATSAVLTFPVAVAHAGVGLLEPAVLLPAFGVAVLSSAVPYSLEMVALRRLPSQTFGILMSLEPALAALFGLLILKEGLTVAQWSAIGCIIAASAGSAGTAGKRRAQAIAVAEVVP